MKKTLLAFSIALLGTSTAMADERPSVEAFLGIDITDWDKSRDIEEELGVDLGVGINLGSNWALEGWYARTESEPLFSSTDVTVQTGSINALRYIGKGKIQPFVSLGVSRLEIDRDGQGSSDDTTLDIGFGIKSYFDNNLILRGDLIGRMYEENDDKQLDPTLRLSVGYAFGGKPRKPAQTSTPVEAPVVVEQPKVEEPPKDSDGDGVIDANDQCADTAANLKVDDKGCALTLTETVSIDLNIQFPNNSDQIKDIYLEEIRGVAKFMQQYAGTVVEVRGYTDDRGSASYNQQLSEKRAKAVAEKLVNAFGVEADRVSAVGYGEQNPIADNSTAEGRAANRRVVAEVSTRVEKNVEK